MYVSDHHRDNNSGNGKSKSGSGGSSILDTSEPRVSDLPSGMSICDRISSPSKHGITELLDSLDSLPSNSRAASNWVCAKSKKKNAVHSTPQFGVNSYKL